MDTIRISGPAHEGNPAESLPMKFRCSPEGGKTSPALADLAWNLYGYL